MYNLGPLFWQFVAPSLLPLCWVDIDHVCRVMTDKGWRRIPMSTTEPVFSNSNFILLDIVLLVPFRQAHKSPCHDCTRKWFAVWVKNLIKASCVWWPICPWDLQNTWSNLSNCQETHKCSNVHRHTHLIWFSPSYIFILILGLVPFENHRKFKNMKMFDSWFSFVVADTIGCIRYIVWVNHYAHAGRACCRYPQHTDGKILLPAGLRYWATFVLYYALPAISAQRYHWCLNDVAVLLLLSWFYLQNFWTWMLIKRQL